MSEGVYRRITRVEDVGNPGLAIWTMGRIRYIKTPIKIINLRVRVGGQIYYFIGTLPLSAMDGSTRKSKASIKLD
jgi:hypothetical protein